VAYVSTPSAWEDWPLLYEPEPSAWEFIPFALVFEPKEEE
jgi:hypothetical protein